MPVCEDIRYGDCTLSSDELESGGLTGQQNEICFIGLDCTIISWGPEHPLHSVNERNNNCPIQAAACWDLR